MRRNTTLGRGSYLRARLLNALQDEQRGRVAATQNPVGALAVVGSDDRYVSTPDAGVPDGQLAVVDTSIDWRVRAIAGTYLRLEGPSQRLHATNAWQANDVTRPLGVRRFCGRTGTGGLGAAAATVANGTPPVVASGAFAVVVDEGASSSARVWLYARPSDGALCVYNASGATLHAEMFVEASGVAPNPSAPPPDVIPTLTDVQWMTGTAAARPADPGGPTLYRATDGGTFSVYDGGAWRSLGGGGGGDVSNPLTADLNADGHKVKGLGDPTDVADAAPKGYVDAAAPPTVAQATTTAAPTTVKTVTVAAGTTKLLRIHVTAADGGARHGAWERCLAVAAAADGTITSLGSFDILAAVTGSGWSSASSHLVVDIGAGSVAVQIVGLDGVSITWSWKVEVQ